ncbi:beta-lactamase/transpeptidase-like protein [Truncatella angustata]|uniref:Beta-lactamase/transpeptidase-like protein n=1 Tax=Truncatella angustata TaxID=152316 RepID=A0A9P8UDT2_9PEZI|nr:beta-lactamase/transpeptidase-like protein [Truncatella angustata]KAH6648082.1 beta-lactamase/transpeptidase-like protein [Truncatella angustata]
MSAEPRVQFQYNNMMYGVAGYLIETLTGSSLRDFFRVHLWEPMGLENTFLGLDDPAIQNSGLLVADEYYYDESTDAYLRLEHANVSGDAAAGAAISNVLDYAKYLRVMLDEEKPMSKAGHRELKTARSFVSGGVAPFVGPITYAFGWMSGVVQGEQIWLHSGQVDGFTTWMLIVPSRQIGITVMTNAASKALTLVLYRILYDLLEVREKDRFDFAAKFLNDVEQEKHYLATCPERVYPNLPSPPLPHTLPLPNHTGRYRDEGYGDFDVLLDCGSTEAATTTARGGSCKLRVQKLEYGPFPWPFILNLDHKSGNYWLGWPEFRGTDIPPACLEVRFRVNASGEVSHFGFNARMEDGAPLVWFDRIDERLDPESSRAVSS